MIWQSENNPAEKPRILQNQIAYIFIIWHTAVAKLKYFFNLEIIFLFYFVRKSLLVSGLPMMNRFSVCVDWLACSYVIAFTYLSGDARREKDKEMYGCLCRVWLIIG